MEFVEDELLISKGRVEGEDDVIEKGKIDDNSEQGRCISLANRICGAIVGIEVPPQRWMRVGEKSLITRWVGRTRLMTTTMAATKPMTSTDHLLVVDGTQR